MYIVKLDSSGTLQWSRTIGGAQNDQVYSIIQTIDGGFAAAGYTASFGAGNSDMYIVKLDSSGTLQWNRTIGGSNYDYATSIIQTTDGGFAVAGYTGTFSAYDYYIVKLNDSGTFQWSKAIGGSSNDEAYSIIQTRDGDFAIAGYTNSFGAASGDFYIVTLDSSGNTCGNSVSTTSTVTTPTPTVTTPTSTITTPNPSVTSPTPTVGSGATVTEICTLVGIEQTGNEILASFYLHHPNPFNPATTISFSIPSQSFVSMKVFDALGKVVAILVSEELSAGTYSKQWDAAGLPSGVYFYRLRAGLFTETKKLILFK
jgi:hypothetical protein